MELKTTWGRNYISYAIQRELRASTRNLITKYVIFYVGGQSNNGRQQIVYNHALSDKFSVKVLLS